MVLFDYTKTINDVVQLTKHLKDNLGIEFKYVTYKPLTQKITVSVVDTVNNNTLTNLINSYSNPFTLAKGGIQTDRTLYIDSIDVFSDTKIRILNSLDVTNKRILNVALPTDAFDGVNKQYVDSAISSMSMGGSSSGVVVIQNSTASTSPSTGALVVVGGVGIGKSLYVSEQIFVLTAPTLASSLTNKTYVDSASYLYAGLGLTKVGGTFSIDSSLTHVNTIGELTGMVSNGIVNITNTTVSLSSTTGALTVAGGIGMSGTLNVGGNVLVMGNSNFIGTVGVPDPIALTDASSKAYTDNISYIFAGTGITKTGSSLSVSATQTQITSVGVLSVFSSSGIVTLTNTTVSTSSITGALQVYGGAGFRENVHVAGNLVITGSSMLTGEVTVPFPTLTTNPTTKLYVDTIAYITAGTGILKTAATLSTSSLQNHVTSIGTLTALSVSGSAIFTGTVTVPDPTSFYQVANKGYVDNMVQGLNVKESVVVATVAAETLSTSFAAGQILDSISLVLGYRILIKNQVNGIENGIYIVTNGTPVRANDFTVGMTVHGDFAFVTEGNVNKTSGWVVQNPVYENVVGTHSLIFVQFSGAGQIVAGFGLLKAGNDISVNVDNQSIEIVSDYLRIKSTAVGTGLSGGSGSPISINSAQPSITSVGNLSSLSVSGISNFSSTVHVPIAVDIESPTRKEYVDSASYLSVVGGLTKIGSVLSINSDQPSVHSLGTLTSLQSDGRITALSTEDSTSIQTGSLVVNGGLGVAKNTFIGGNLHVDGGSINYKTALKTYVAESITSGNASLVYRIRFDDPVNSDARFSIGNVATSGYYESRFQLYALNVVEQSPNTERLEFGAGISGGFMRWIRTGSGLNKPFHMLSGTIFNTDSTVSIISTENSTSVSTGALKISGGLGVVGSICSGSIYSTNGNIANLTVSRTTESTSVLTGSLLCSGGVGISKNVNVGGGLFISGNSIFTGKLTVISPVDPFDAVNKGYLDNNLALAGNGLSKIGIYLHINSSQPTITSVGILTSLTSSGSITITNTAESTNTNTGALIVAGGITTAKNLLVNGESNLIGKVRFASNTHLEISASGLGTAYRWRANDAVNTQCRMTLGNTATTSHYETHIGLFALNTHESSANSEKLEIGANGTNSYIKYQILGTGTLKPFCIYEKSFFNIDGTVSFTSTTDSTSIGTGAVKIIGGLGVSGSVFIGGILNVTGAVSVPIPTGPSHATTKSYVDGLSYISVGSGLTKTQNTLSLNTSQTTITSIGILSSLTVSGILNITDTTESTSTLTGALMIAGGVGIVKNLNVGGNVSIGINFNVTGNSIFLGTVTVPTPTLAGHAVHKNYVDDLSYFRPGLGLGRDNNGNFVTNPNQNHVNQVGALLGLTSSGVVLITNTTESSSVNTGSLLVSGGAAFAKSLSIGGSVTIGGNLSVTGAIAFSSSVTIQTPVNSTDAANKLYVDGISYLSVGVGLSKTGSTISVTSSQPTITSLSTLTTLTVSGSTSITSAVASVSPTTGALKITGGLGIGGVINSGNTTDSTSATTGSIVTAGGIGSNKTIWAATLTTNGALRMKGSTSGTTSIVTSQTTVDYTLTLPPAAPATTSFLSVAPNGVSSFSVLPLMAIYNDTTLTSGCKMYVMTVTTISGLAICYPTSNGISSGTALFSTIIFATATAQSNTLNFSQAPFASLKSISADLKTISFNVLTGNILTKAGPTIIPSPNGVTVRIMIFGL